MRWDPFSSKDASNFFMRLQGTKDRHKAPERSRRMAEFFEGGRSDSDADGYGYLHPFGTGKTGASMLRFLRRR
jgi:hypothetical protein